MYRPKRWQINPPQPAACELAARLKTSPLISQILLNRGICTFDDAQAFLQPSLLALADPALLPGLPAAAARIAKAIRDREKIVVYGDYDVDGITATSILWHAITLLGGQIDTYIPHRIDEGYGLNSEALTQIIDNGAQLIVTVDCGITALEPAAIARQRNVDLIVSDHHQWHGDPPRLPDCHTIVHPRLPGTGLPYPNPNLCGAGIAFKLAWGIGQAVTGATRVSESFRNFLVEATALAALGTIADVVPLVGENRILAHFGLGGLQQSKLTGIRALIESANLTGRNLDSYHVGFLLAPRLNACGRLGHAALALEMLTTAGESRAREIAVYLESQNRDRQTVEKQILEQALTQIESNGWADQRHRALVLGAEGWHAGVIGIVASRIVDRFCRPVVMVALNNGQGQGSARSIAGFHLARALESCGEHLLAFGGHEMAAGLKIQPDHLDDFRRAFCDYAAANVTDEMLIPQLCLESMADLSQITEPLVRELQRLAPFGHGNRKPLLCIDAATVATPPRRVGKTGDHLQLMVKQNRQTIRCIAFQCGELIDRLSPNTAVRLAVEPCLNEYNGRTNVELQIKDFQFASSAGD
ncbi:MAG TPA: single-stranded-DNA-specific exonuclease RecJ [Tepidisphaeraceae bacterium]|jgi:single-stranded-DNA-specific exonuclease|nr:single-stranded-DNA-specific exonuclease RecJ [Tepidisphaeraceae bacterium]